MPSPFPGMDPYLEKRSIWPGLHLRLLYNISEALQQQVRPKYIANIGERIELETLNKVYVPDVLVVGPSRELAETRISSGALVADEPQTISVLDEERRVPILKLSIARRVMWSR